MKMTDAEILHNIKQKFHISEFVGPQVYKKYGDDAWKFIDIRLLQTIDVLRYWIDKPITINNYYWGGSFKQRGLRTNLGSIFMGKFKKGILYLSAHVLGKAVDFDVQGMTAIEVRNWIVANQKIFPFKIRLETGVNWVHLDIISEEKNPKIYKFIP